MILQLPSTHEFKKKAQQWASGFECCCILDSNAYPDHYSKFDFAVGVDFTAKVETNSFAEIDSFKEKHNQDWIFGGFSYDLKNDVEQLSSCNPDFVGFPTAFFFVPKHILILKGNRLEIISESEKKIWEEIQNAGVNFPSQKRKLKIKQRFNKKDYLKTVHQIIHEISIGNIYETNFCMEFFAEETKIHPFLTYTKLNQHSPTPFSNYFKWFDQHIISATPERFLAKREQKLISQPIKGTARRGKNLQEDEAIIQTLKENSKELQENVMIVDLVRNDLTKSARKGTVKVEELCGVYSFKQVHHLVSTVVCDKRDGLSDVSVIKNTFPMGSMTGAPKVKAMELTERFELTKRGMYSGSVGYFSPDGDFDFNVVIRTILYDEKRNYLSFQVGSAITYYAIPEQEYEECLLKAKAILEVLA